MFSIRLRKTDTLFSKYLREKIGCCEVCGNTETLQVSHFHGRRHENTRFSEMNCDVLCFTCHRKFHEDPNNYVEWKKRKLGDKFHLLTIAVNTYKKRDDKMDLLYLKKLTSV